MPRLKTPQHYQSVIDRIITSYGGREKLEQEFKEHRRKGKERLQAFKDYKKLCYAEKGLESLKQGASQEENATDTDGGRREDKEDSHMEVEAESSRESDINDEVHPTDFGVEEEAHSELEDASNEKCDDRSCDNCHRQNSSELKEDIYDITFHVVTSDMIKRRKFITFRVPKKEIKEHMLCQNCLLYLTSLVKKEILDNAWTGFLWKLLTNKEVINIYGRYTWALLPNELRHWWISNLKTMEPQVYGQIGTNEPKTSIADVTKDIAEWERLIDSFTLPNLARACDNYLIPKILCPFGCSEFLHKKGFIAMDIVFQRYLPHVIIDLYSKREQMKRVLNCREDFIALKDGIHSKWLLNDKWKVKPSIAFIEGVPMVLSCKEHHNGSNKFHIHPCKQPFHNLSSSKSDQLCHGVLKPRTIKQLQKSKYSDSFQMHEQRGSFNGIDTCTITNHHNFGYRSKLQSEAESRSLMNRADINHLLTQLANEKLISKIIANDKRKLAQRLYSTFDFEAYKYGATYVPMKVAMEFHRVVTNPFLKVIIDDRIDGNGNALPGIIVKNKRHWPPYLYPCQKATKWGALILRTPIFKNKNGCTKTLWTVTSMLISVEKLYRIVYESAPLIKSDWRGWLLVYIT